jgi:hypothetical protein
MSPEPKRDWSGITRSALRKWLKRHEAEGRPVWKTGAVALTIPQSLDPGLFDCSNNINIGEWTVVLQIVENMKGFEFHPDGHSLLITLFDSCEVNWSPA